MWYLGGVGDTAKHKVERCDFDEWLTMIEDNKGGHVVSSNIKKFLTICLEEV